MSNELQTTAITESQVHWSTSELLDVPPVRVVTELDSLRLRERLATFVDGRHVNDALYRAIVAIRANYSIEPWAYVVVFPAHRLEIPIDLRTIADEPSRLVAIVKEPRSTLEMMFDLAELNGRLADEMAGMPREAAISALKSLSRDGQTFFVHDRCDSDDRFSHVFTDGSYHHNYRYVSSQLPEAR